MKTESEAQFEQFCSEVSWSVVPIETTRARTPDYALSLQGTAVIVEVKEITRNYFASVSEGREVFSRKAREILRHKISKAAPQLKTEAKGAHPCLFVIYDRLNPALRLNAKPYDILAAMYGRPIMRFTVLSRDKLVHKDTLFGPERKVTPTSNTSVSALASLWLRSDGRLGLDVFHNVYAKRPLSPKLIHNPRVSQFTIRPFERKFHPWMPVALEGEA